MILWLLNMKSLIEILAYLLFNKKFIHLNWPVSLSLSLSLSLKSTTAISQSNSSRPNQRISAQIMREIQHCWPDKTKQPNRRAPHLVRPRHTSIKIGLGNKLNSQEYAMNTCDLPGQRTGVTAPHACCEIAMGLVAVAKDGASGGGRSAWPSARRRARQIEIHKLSIAFPQQQGGWSALECCCCCSFH